MINNSPAKRDWLHRQPSSVDSFAKALNKQPVQEASPSSSTSASETASTQEPVAAVSHSQDDGPIMFDLRPFDAPKRQSLQRMRAERLRAEETMLYDRDSVTMLQKTMAADPVVVPRSVLNRMRAARMHEEERELNVFDSQNGTLEKYLRSAPTESPGGGIETDTADSESFARLPEDVGNSMSFGSLLVGALRLSDDMMPAITRKDLHRRRAELLHTEERLLEEKQAAALHAEPKSLQVVTGIGGDIAHARHALQRLRAQRMHEEERSLYTAQGIVVE